MPGLKLTIVASIYGKPYKWVRTLAIPAPTTTTATIMPSSSPTSPVLLNTNNGERISPVGRRIINRCALSAHDKGRSNLGFGGVYKSYSSIYSPKSCSEDKGGEREPSALATDDDAMGPEHSGNCVQNQQQFQHQQPSKLLTLPTILTLGRVAAVPFLVSTFYVDSWWGTTATTSIFIAAAITDWLDGYIARKMRLGTTFGAFLDPVADKLMVAATLVLLCTRPLDVDMFVRVPWLLPVPSIAIIGREITMSAVREWAASQNGKLSEAVAVNNLGKWKTATQMTALTILLATRDSSLAGPGILVGSGIVLLYISAGLAVWSLVVYMRKIWKVLIR